MLAADGLLPSHSAVHRWLLEKCPTLEFLENTRTLILLLETTKRTIDRLVLLDRYSNHGLFTSFPFGLCGCCCYIVCGKITLSCGSPDVRSRPESERTNGIR